MIFFQVDLKPRLNIRENWTNGNVITLPTENVLGYEIARLFSGLNCTNESKKTYYLSDPYLEHYGKTMTLSVGRITNTALLSLDVKLRDFLEDVTYLSAKPSLYAILFDKKGIIWMHKKFPRVETLQEQPLKVHLRDIENIDIATVNKMINQSDGVMDITNKLQVKVSTFNTSFYPVMPNRVNFL